MREFKIVRISSSGEDHEDYLMFEDRDKAETWAILQNEKRAGSVLAITDVTVHNDLKHEY